MKMFQSSLGQFPSDFCWFSHIFPTEFAWNPCIIMGNLQVCGEREVGEGGSLQFCKCHSAHTFPFSLSIWLVNRRRECARERRRLWGSRRRGSSRRLKEINVTVDSAHFTCCVCERGVRGNVRVGVGEVWKKSDRSHTHKFIPRISSAASAESGKCWIYL